jgi:hypothetical protein
VDLEQIVLPALVAATSLAAFLIGTRRLGLPRGGLRRASARALEAIGLIFVFAAANLGLGVAVILGWRALTGEFLSLYLLNDAALGLLSLVQALVFQWWWARAD